MGERMLNLCQRKTIWQFTAYTRTHQYTGVGFRSTRRHAERPFTRIPTKWGLWKLNHSKWCILKKCLCLPHIQSNSSHHKQSYRRHYENTCVVTYCNDNRQRFSFRLKCVTQNNNCSDITTRHATTKHAQTIQAPEKKHATMKSSLKMSSGEFQNHWNKCLPLAISNYNTTYHTSIRCERSRINHGRVLTTYLTTGTD